MTVTVIDPSKPKCTRCDGCGKIANSTDGEPWSQWANLPPGADIAVRLGVVKPLPCPLCHGTGRTP